LVAGKIAVNAGLFGAPFIMLMNFDLLLGLAAFGRKTKGILT